jgi:hypothetical protein
LTSGVGKLLEAFLLDREESFLLAERDFDLLNIGFVQDHYGALLDSKNFENFLAGLVE